MNRKKHTILKRRIGITALVIPLLLISGCAPKQTPPIAIPIAPVVTESVVPSLQKVSSGIDRGLDTNHQIDTKIKQQQNTVLEQKIVIVETIAKVERLKEKAKAKQLIEEIELIDIINDLNKIQQRNLFLEKQNTELDTIRKDQEAILKMTKEDASITYKKLMDKENEAKELRSQNTFLAKNLENKNKEVESLKKNLQKEKVRAARASVYRNWIIGIVSAFVLWTIVKNVLMMYFPLTKFRI